MEVRPRAMFVRNQRSNSTKEKFLFFFNVRALVVDTWGPLIGPVIVGERAVDARTVGLSSASLS